MNESNQLNASALASQIAALKNNDESSEKAKAKPKTVESAETEVKSMVDDMHKELSEARFLPVGTDLNRWQSMIPAASAPLRTNYNLEEHGIVLNQCRAVHSAHEKATTTLQLKAFKNENMARVEDIKTFSMAGGQFKQNAQEQEVAICKDAIRSLLNYVVIRLK